MIMSLVVRVRTITFAAAAVLALALPASAQDISDSHIKAARLALDALNATDQFDAILPQAAAALKAETFDVESLAQRGFGNEALDQLVVDHILGIA